MRRVGTELLLFALSLSNNLLTGSTINPYSGSSDLSRTTLFLYGNRFTGAVNASSLSGVQQLGNVYLFGCIPGQEVRLASGIANRTIIVEDSLFCDRSDIACVCAYCPSYCVLVCGNCSAGS